MDKATQNERRFMTSKMSEVRADGETGVISGYAIVFNSRSVLLYGQFYETILPASMNGVINRSDCMALLDHNRSRGILGRSKFGKGTLSLSVDKRGVFTEFTPPETSLAEEVKEYINRGEIDSMSFEFRLAEEGDKWQEIAGGKYERTILKFDQILDVSLVFNAAYPATTAAVRSLDEFRKGGKPDPPPVSLDELSAYYEDFENKLNKLK